MTFLIENLLDILKIIIFITDYYLYKLTYILTCTDSDVHLLKGSRVCQQVISAPNISVFKPKPLSHSIITSFLLTFNQIGAVIDILTNQIESLWVTLYSIGHYTFTLINSFTSNIHKETKYIKYCM